MLSLQNSYDQAANTLQAFSAVADSNQRVPIEDLSRLVKLLRGHLCKNIESVSDKNLKQELLQYDPRHLTRSHGESQTASDKEPKLPGKHSLMQICKFGRRKHLEFIDETLKACHSNRGPAAATATAPSDDDNNAESTVEKVLSQVQGNKGSEDP